MAGLTCLDNVIGIKNGCTPETPSSGLYVNDLPGITLGLADAIVTEEDESAVQWINSKIDYAKQRIIQDFRTYLKPKMRANSILDQDTVGRFQENLQLNSAEAGLYRGINLEVHSNNYLSMYISKIRLKIDNTGTHTVNIINLMTGKIEDTVVISTVAGEPSEVVVNKDYPIVRQELQLLIAVDTSIAGSYNTEVEGNYNGCKACNNKTGLVQRSAKQISTGGSLINSNLQSANHTNGLSVDYSLRCSLDPYICTYAIELGYALWQRTGAEIMMEASHSKRINSFINIHSDDYIALREEYEARYESSMNQILENIGVVNDWCFKCTPAIKTAVQIP